MLFETVALKETKSCVERCTMQIEVAILNSVCFVSLTVVCDEIVSLWLTEHLYKKELFVWIVWPCRSCCSEFGAFISRLYCELDMELDCISS